MFFVCVGNLWLPGKRVYKRLSSKTYVPFSHVAQDLLNVMKVMRENTNKRNLSYYYFLYSSLLARVYFYALYLNGAIIQFIANARRLIVSENRKTLTRISSNPIQQPGPSTEKANRILHQLYHIYPRESPSFDHFV